MDKGQTSRIIRGMVERELLYTPEEELTKDRNRKLAMTETAVEVYEDLSQRLNDLSARTGYNLNSDEVATLYDLLDRLEYHLSRMHIKI